MKTEDKNPAQRVRVAVLGTVNVGKSGKFQKCYEKKNIKSKFLNK